MSNDWKKTRHEIQSVGNKRKKRLKKYNRPSWFGLVCFVLFSFKKKRKSFTSPKKKKNHMNNKHKLDYEHGNFVNDDDDDFQKH